MASRSEYTNTLAEVNPNAIPDGWGQWQWPGGTPDVLLGTVNYRNEKTNCSFPMRKELVELTGLCLQIAADVYDYQVWGSPNPGYEPTWGPWGYENRPISGTQRASNHSKGRAMDWNAPQNSYTDWTECEIPPGLVAVMQDLGWYWGGFYGDRMHFEYVGSLDSVPAAVTRARAILNPPAPPTPTPVPDDLIEEIEAMTDDERKAFVDEIATAAAAKVWATVTPRHSAWKNNEQYAAAGRTALDTIAGAENNTAQLRAGN